MAVPFSPEPTKREKVAVGRERLPRPRPKTHDNLLTFPAFSRRGLQRRRQHHGEIADAAEDGMRVVGPSSTATRH